MIDAMIHRFESRGYVGEGRMVARNMKNLKLIIPTDITQYR